MFILCLISAMLKQQELGTIMEDTVKKGDTKYTET